MFAAIVLAGGVARRMGGANKPARTVGGRLLLARVLAAVPADRPRVVVGPPNLAALLPTGVDLTREDPPGGGPVAAIAAGLRLLARTAVGPGPDETVAVLAGDLPFLSAGDVSELRAAVLADDDRDGAVFVDATDRPQWLAGVWRPAALTARLADLGDPSGHGMRDLVRGLRITRIRRDDLSGPPAWFDCDTEEDLRQAEEWARGEPG